MDRQTEQLIERTKNRRELLTKKLGETPDAVPRKRRTPLVDDDNENIPPPNLEDDDSPKRHCSTREKLQGPKPDTPAIKSVKSRMTALAGQRTEWSSSGDETEVNRPPPPRADSPAEQKFSAPTLRKSRLANLAQTIGDWEDDLSHPTIVKEEPKKSKWQRPKPTETQENYDANERKERSRIFSGNRNKYKAPSPPNGENLKPQMQNPPQKTPTKYQAPNPPELPRPKSPSKLALPTTLPAKSSPVQKTTSPAKVRHHEIRCPIETIPINTGMDDSFASGEETDEPTKKPVTARMVNWEQRTNNSPQRNAEPTQQPIASRFATWEQRASQTPTRPLPRTPGVGSRTPGLGTPRQNFTPNKFGSLGKLPLPKKTEPAPSNTGDAKGKENDNNSIDPASKPVSERMAKWQQKVKGLNMEPKEDEPTAYSVIARMSAWEHMSSSNRVSHVKKVEPGSSPAKTPAKTSPCSPAVKPPRSTGKPQAQSISKPSMKPQKSFVESIREKANEINSPKSVPSPKATDNLSKPPRMHVPSNTWTPGKSNATMPQKANLPVNSPKPHLSPEQQEVLSPKENTLSPSNASIAMKTIHQRLMEQTAESTTCKTMAEKMREERMKELTFIQNRWQNGILKEGDSDSQPEHNGDHSPPKIQRLSDVVRSKDDEKEAVRAKIRSDFERKLACMGFDISTGGHAVATVSPRKYRRNAVAGSGSSPEGDAHSDKLRNTALHTPTPPTPALPGRHDNKLPPGQHKGGTSSILKLVGNKPLPLSLPKPAIYETQPTKEKFDDGFASDGGASTSSYRSRTRESVDSDIVETTQDEEGKYEDSETQDSLEGDSSFERFRGDIGAPLDEGDDVSLSAFVPASVRRQSVLPNAEPSHDRLSLTSQSSSEDFHPPQKPPHTPVQRQRSKDEDRVVIHTSTVDLKTLAQRQYKAQMSTASLNSNASTNSESSVGETYEERQKYYETEDTETEDDESRQEIGDLLDEAIDGNEDKPPVAAPRKRRSHMMASANSAMEDKDCPLVYSVSMYRSRRYARDTRPPPRMVIKRSQMPQKEVEEEDIQMSTAPHVSKQASRRSIEEKIRELTELGNQELSIIKQTSNALNQCCLGNASFAGSAEQAECNRLLLISSQRRMAYMSEIQRLKDQRTLEEHPDGPKGSLTITEMRLPLKREFVTKLGTSADSSVHYFILLVRNGSHIIVTEMLSTHDEKMRGSLDFPNHINLNDIIGSFQIQLEIYGMSITRELNLKDKKKNKTPKKKGRDLKPVQSPGGPNAVLTSSFKLISVLPITMKSVDKACFNLEKVPYVSPLYGTIYMRLKCTKEANVQERGFLTMFEDVSGLGAWHRRWCVLSANKVCFWKYPDDEGKKEAMGIIDLKRCITEKVGVIPRDVCARQHTFELTTVRQPRQGEQDTLISKTYSTMTTIRHMLSADTKEERILWCNKINKALLNIRTWHADAARPIRAAKPTH